MKEILRKKQFGFLFAAFTIFLSSFFLRHQILQLAIEVYLDVRVPGNGWKIDYDHSYVKNGQISFSNVKLASKSAFLECEIERVELVVKRRSGIKFDYGLKVQSPCISLKEGGSNSFSLAEFANSSFSRMKIDVYDGEVSLIGKEDPTKFYFSLASDEERRALGTLSLSSIPSQKGAPNVCMKLFEWPEEFIFELEFQDCLLSFLSQMGKAFAGDSFPNWNVSHGEINGRLWLGLAKTCELREANASLRITDAHATHDVDGLDVSIDSLLVDTTYPNGKKGGYFWQNLALKLDIKGGRIGCRDEKTNVDFALCNLTGNLNFHSIKDSEILLKGYLDHKGELTPVVLSASPSKIDKETLDVDFKVLESNFLAHLNLSIAREGDDLCVVRGKLKEMEAPQLAMLQHAFSFFSPQLKCFQLNKGKLTSELSLRIVNGKIEKVLLDNLLADDLEVYCKANDLLATCSHLSGSATLDFQNLFSFQMPSWDVNVQNGEILRGGEKPEALQNVSMQLFMCRKVFEPSWIRATYGGIDILLDVVGYYSEADLNMHLSTNGEKLLQLICGKLKDFSRFSQHKIHTDLDFHRQLGYWEVLGKAYLNVIDSFEDSLKFGLYLSDEVLREGKLSTRIHDSISKGWFISDTISAEFMKFVNAYTGSDWLLEGMGLLKGTFTGKELDAKVGFSHANFFSSEIDIWLHPTKDLEGNIFIDFERMEFSGNIPLYEARIHEKSVDLVFNNTNGQLCLKKGSINLEKFITEIEGLILGGNLEFLFPTLKLDIDSCIGNVRQVEKMLKKFPNWKGFEVPFDGLVRNTEEKISILYDPLKELELVINLELLHGTWEVLPNLTVLDLSFDLNLIGKRVALTNVCGKIPSKFHQGGYSLNGKKLQFDFGDTPNLIFDLRLENQVMDLIQVAGSYDLDSKILDLDKTKSHLFGVFPVEFYCKLKDEFFINLEMPFQELESCSKVLNDMQLLNEIPFDLFEKVKDYNTAISSEISYSNGALSINLSSEIFSLEARLEGKDWKVPSIKAGLFDISLELEKSDTGYKIFNAKCLSNNSLAHFGEGQIDLETSRVFLPLKEAILNFSECFPMIGSGRASLMGDMTIDFSRGFPNSFIEGNIRIDAEKEEFRIASLSEVHIIYTLDRGLVIKDAVLEIACENAKSVVSIPFGSYSFDDKLWQGYQIKTSYSELEIGCFLKKTGLQIEVPRNACGKTEFVFDVEVLKDQFQISGAFGKGTYLWKGHEMFLKELRWFYDKSHFDIDAEVPFCGFDFTIHAKVYPSISCPVIIEGFQRGVEDRLLYAECQLFDPKGISIQKIQGNLFGVDFQFLEASKMDDWNFLADLRIDALRLKQVVGPDAKMLIDELKFHKGYELKGDLTCKKENLKESFFEGYLKGRDFDFLGYMFKTLLANIHVDQKGVSLKNLTISDEAVTVSIPELAINVSSKGDLILRIPELKIDELRPSILKKKHIRERAKPFCIKSMVFQDITGNLSDEKSFTGRGQLKFINTFKEGHNLLDIPIDIISRLGLDSGLLVPVQGELDFVLKNGRLVFTKLKNSYSESKRSYFYLWNKSESYIDFSGNMHIDIRMKQYVLFKITELFILSLQGTLEKPKCFLR